MNAWFYDIIVKKLAVFTSTTRSCLTKTTGSEPGNPVKSSLVSFYARRSTTHKQGVSGSDVTFFPVARVEKLLNMLVKNMRGSTISYPSFIRQGWTDLSHFLKKVSESFISGPSKDTRSGKKGPTFDRKIIERPYTKQRKRWRKNYPYILDNHATVRVTTDP